MHEAVRQTKNRSNVVFSLNCCDVSSSGHELTVLFVEHPVTEMISTLPV